MPVSNETLTTCFHVLPDLLFNNHHIKQLCKGLQSQHQTASLNQSQDIRWSRPDLTVCDNSRWGTVKGNVFQLRLTYAEDLKLSSRPVFIAFSLQRKRSVFKEQGRGLNKAPRIYAHNHGTTLLQRDCEYSIWTYCRGAQIFRQFSSHLKILGARTVKGRKFPNGDTQILGATIQSWRQGFVQTLSIVLKCIMLCPTTDVRINTAVQRCAVYHVNNGYRQR